MVHTGSQGGSSGSLRAILFNTWKPFTFCVKGCSKHKDPKGSSSLEILSLYPHRRISRYHTFPTLLTSAMPPSDPNDSQGSTPQALEHPAQTPIAHHHIT